MLLNDDLIRQFLQDKIREEMKILLIAQKNETEEKILKLQDAAKELCMSPHTLRKYAKKGKIPTVASQVRGLRFLRSDLVSWAKANRSSII